MARKHREVGPKGLKGTGEGRLRTTFHTTHSKVLECQKSYDLITYQAIARAPLQMMKVQRKVLKARIDLTFSQAPAKVRVVRAIRLVITVPHFNMQFHQECG